MTILHLRASNFYGGPERQLHLHALGARKCGLNIIVSSFSEPAGIPEFLNRIDVDGIPVHTFEVKNAYDLSAIARVEQYLSSANIDLLCTHDYRTHLIGWRAARNAKKKWIAFSRGWTAESLKIRIYHTFDKIIVRFADHIVAVSNAQKRKLRRLIIADQRISVVHNAIDPHSLEDIPAVDLRGKFGFPINAFIVVSAGRFSAEKGQEDLIRAADKLASEDDRLRFVLFGDGPDLESLRSTVAGLRNNDRIMMPGFEKNIIGCLKSADLVVNPSLSEGLPNVVLEAMAVGVPVVATNVGGVPELVEDGISGFLVPPASPEALGDRIRDAMSDSEQAQRCAANARRVVTEKFSFESQNTRLMDIYRKVLAQNA